MAMTSVTRSRRADGLCLPHPKLPNSHRVLTSSNAKSADQQFAAANANAPRAPKRQLDTGPGRDFDPTVTKRARIAVEIPSRSSFHSRFSNTNVTPPAPAPAAAPAPPATRAAPKASSAVASPNAAPARAPPAKTANPEAAALTKHQEKVANGLKHELNRLQPNAIDTKEQGRKLRSQESVRHKSELSNYFPEYDEVIGNEPKETHLLTVDTPIIITEGTTPQSQPHPHPQPSDTYPVRSYGDSLFTDLFDSQTIDFSFLNKGSNSTSSTTNSNKPLDPTDDPLPDTLFEPAHKRAERVERSIRNSEKGRAQHEKDQIIRLLDGLQGHDWLRVMGVSGITESRKRAFEPAREHFIKGCQGILEKFRRWAAEEKRRKLEKERAGRLAAASEEVDDGEEGREHGDDGDDEEEEEGEGEEEIADSDAEMGGSGDEEGEEVEGEPPDDDNNNNDSDVDASVAKQLREEALAAAAAKKKIAASRRGGRAGGKAPLVSAAKTEPEPPQPLKEFTSFFAKRYQREAALSKNRRRGRNVLAWGHAVPDMAEAEFELPVELRDEHTLRTRARGKRRDRRGRA